MKSPRLEHLLLPGTTAENGKPRVELAYGHFEQSESEQSRHRCYLVCRDMFGKPILLANIRLDQN